MEALGIYSCAEISCKQKVADGGLVVFFIIFFYKLLEIMQEISAYKSKVRTD